MGLAELGVILAILVLLFGAKKLPALADGMGKAIRNFKRGISGDDETDVTPSDKQVTKSSSAVEIDRDAADAAPSREAKG